jgi:hypothetical protein
MQRALARMEAKMATNRAKKVLPLSLLIVAALGGIGSYATAGADPLPYGPDTCIQGFVWREAQSGDTVCVTPATRDTTAQDNAAAAGRVDPGGAYGPNTCKQGFVWREAYGGDVVCVTPATRSQAASDNSAAASRKAANAPAAAPPPATQPCQIISLPPFINPC